MMMSPTRNTTTRTLEVSLIEVLSGDTVEDHGVIGRSASKLDSPDPGFSGL